jgi:hypothetical protein
MTSHTKSCPDLATVLPPYLPPLRLVRSFRCNLAQPIPTFLQDLLAEKICSTCPEKCGRIIDLLKNIQTYGILDTGAEGRMWFEIRKILKSDVLKDDRIFEDGRAVRSILEKRLHPKHVECFGSLEIGSPISPLHITFRRVKGRPSAEKVEALLSPTLKAPSLIYRQTST